jgi:ribA/ribD-fused uncharacterized protein
MSEQANSSEVKRIDCFRGPYRFLSNFYTVPILFEHRVYLSVENAYQASKFATESPQRDVIQRASPGTAKRIGRTARTNLSKEKLKEQNKSQMLEFLRIKFKPGCYVSQKLIDTFPMDLVEGNTWGDVYWGECSGVGENMLGQLLMQVREELMNNLT